MNFLMNIIFSTSILLLLYGKTDQQDIIQTVLNIGEYKHFSVHAPRFESTTNHDYGEIYLVSFKGMDTQANYKFKNKVVIIRDHKNIEEGKADFIIEIDEIKIEKNQAKILLSYKNPKIYHQEKKIILLNATLSKDNTGNWLVNEHQFFQVSISD